jgi:hypothetical protein
MWSLGTLFGKTLKVDMKFTREKGVLRILVVCLDFRRIPAKERIFIADGFYDICFEVEAQREVVTNMEVNPGEDHSDHDGHGKNEDSTSENQKNLDDMETDVAHNRHELNGSKNDASNGPDINKLAGDFSSGVKFSPRVKLMMEQSKKEIAIFINSLVPAAATAEEQQIVAAAAGDVGCAESSAGAGKLGRGRNFAVCRCRGRGAADSRCLAICVALLRDRCWGRILTEPGPACRGAACARFCCRGRRRRC